MNLNFKFTVLINCDILYLLAQVGGLRWAIPEAREQHPEWLFRLEDLFFSLTWFNSNNCYGPKEKTSLFDILQKS